MPENRFFTPEPFEKGQTIILRDDELHHLRVMRPSVNDTVELVNGKNQLAKGRLDHLTPKEATLSIESFETHPPPKQLILAQALLRPKNLDLVIEKGTELGATAFYLFPGEKSEKTTLSKNQLQRCHHLAKSALKQCGRLDLPQIQLLPPLTKWSHYPPLPAFFGSLNAQDRYKPSQTGALLFVGPEKGFSPEEEALLANSATPVRIHPYVLRAETAALCFLAQSI